MLPKKMRVMPEDEYAALKLKAAELDEITRALWAESKAGNHFAWQFIRAYRVAGPNGEGIDEA